MWKKPNELREGSLRYKWRKERFRYIEKIINKHINENKHVKIIDVGGTAKYWNLLDPELAKYCSITVVNLEKWLDPAKAGACTSGAEVELAVGDGCNLKEFKDNEFHLAHSNSVIEHVGSLTKMRSFSKELQRVGQSHYCQTPYLWFPIEPHYGFPFFHWLPDATRAKLLHKFKIGWRARIVDYESALEEADCTTLLDIYFFKSLFGESEFRKETIYGITKSLIAFKL